MNVEAMSYAEGYRFDGVGRTEEGGDFGFCGFVSGGGEGCYSSGTAAEDGSA